MVKRELAEQHPAAAGQPAAKARRTAKWAAFCEDKTCIQWAAEMASAQTATPNATMALATDSAQASAQTAKAAAEVPGPKRKANWLSTWQRRQRNTLKYAELHLAYWYNVVQREKMQLQAHLDGNRRSEELQLEEIKNKDGVVVAHIDPDPDIDRLHIKIWSPTGEKYICFLDATFADTINYVKKNRSIQMSCI